MTVIAPRSTLMFVVISIVVLILAFVSAQRQNANKQSNHTLQSKVRDLAWTKVHTHGSHRSEIYHSGSRLSGSLDTVGFGFTDLVAQSKRKMPALAMALSENQRRLLVAHMPESGKKLSRGEGLWQPMTGRLSALDSSS